MALPTALIVSCCDKDPKELVQMITGNDNLPSPTPLIESIQAYPWFIETKYYTADIHLCTVRNKTIGNLEFAESVQAVVIYFDSKLESSFDKVKEWMTFIKELSPEIQLLVCDNISENAVDVDKLKVQHWCLKNSFELVELFPDVDEIDCEDDFPETTGIKRIIQALHAHLWPNLQMKNKSGLSALNVDSVLEPNSNHSTLHDSTLTSASDVEKNFQDLNITSSQKEENKEIQSGSESILSAVDEDCSEVIPSSIVSQILGDDDESAEPSFELLFQRFHQMKEKAQNLPFEERKSYAEKVAVAFWRAIGGDEEEIEGIEND